MKKTSLDIPACHACTAGNAHLCHLSAPQQELLSEFRQEAFFRKGAIIFREGDRPHGLFCLHKGKVKISKLGESGREQVVRLGNAGEMLGYRAVFAGEEYSATATALEDCEVCMLSKERFFELMEKNPGFNRSILQLLARDIRMAEEATARMGRSGARSRVAEALLKLHAKFGVRADGKTLLVALSRQDIADLAGVAPETTIRALSAFSTAGWVALHGREIEVIELAKLQDLALSGKD